MKIMRAATLWLCASSLFLCACAVGWNHTADAALARTFRLHEAEFEALLAEVQTDSQLTTLQRNTVIYGGRLVNLHDSDLAEIERVGLPRERWMRASCPNKPGWIPDIR
jgi:hypothetical protein